MKSYKTIIAGSRTITNQQLVFNVIDYILLQNKFIISEVVCGMASGVDIIGYKWAQNNNILIKEYPANWKKYKGYAGLLRNKEMAEYADACICIWDGISNGTKNMIEEANKNNLILYIVKKNELKDIQNKMWKIKLKNKLK